MNQVKTLELRKKLTEIVDHSEFLSQFILPNQTQIESLNAFQRMIPTGSAKYFSYSASVYLIMSTDCNKAHELTSVM